VVELETTADKGSIEIALPAAMMEDSLRIRPGIGSSIRRVDIVTTRMDSGKGEKELNAMLEQRSRWAADFRRLQPAKRP
jgi:hypothetical protein